MRSRFTRPVGRQRRPTLKGKRVPNSARNRLQFRWAAAIPAREWSVYRRALDAMQSAGVQFMVGGGFAFAAYTGRWRDTKDIDLYICPQDRERAIRALERAGFSDYYRRRAYDRKWIYRAVRSEVIVDIIWAMANQRARVDALWLQRAPPLEIRDEKLLVIPLEELIWCKLYIVQRDRCDWTDIFNLLYATNGQLDWNHLLRRLEDEQPLLQSLLTLYRWLCPGRAKQIPPRLWRSRLPASVSAQTTIRRSKLLDSRAWFAPMQAPSRKFEI